MEPTMASLPRILTTVPTGRVRREKREVHDILARLGVEHARGLGVHQQLHA
jgi:hypothetical protein